MSNELVPKEELETIWRATEDLPATTPVETRRAVIAIRKAGAGHDPIEAMALAYPHFMRFVIDSVARTEHALTKDTSAFQHLVAGTETIVKTLQNVNHLEGLIEALVDRIQILEAKIDALDVPIKKSFDGAMVAREEGDIDPEQKAEAARKRTIGSAWAK